MSTAPLLDAFPGLQGVQAFFTTRDGGFSAPPYQSLNLGFHTSDEPTLVSRNWARLLSARELDSKIHVSPKLEHGARLVEADPTGPSPIADALCTGSTEIVLSITTADCLPILLFDPVCHWVAAIHAGWRGTRSGILRNTLTRMLREGRIRRESTRIAFGPCIGPEAYEIGPEVSTQFSQQHILSISGKPHLDLAGANLAQVDEAGFHADCVARRDRCTYSDPDAFFSYRRDGQHTGRMAAVISLDRQ